MMTKISSSELKLNTKEILNDYKIACESREASLIGRKEVFMGKAKFGIFGDGKEIAQIAMAKAFQAGDIRSGYYRDQTFMFAIGELTLEQYFAQLYAHTDVEADPVSAGRMMNGHFGTRMLNEDGSWKDLTKQPHSSADISCTAGQMPRLVGLAYASKLYRENKDLHQFQNFSKNGNEIAFGTIGNASTSEGLFWEAMNAAGVLQIPMLMSVWDDEYGISVPQKYHTTKLSISKALEGFQQNEEEKGLEILEVKGWDYLALCEVYQKATYLCRTEHVPVLIHVTEITQPQGHSTSGSHERYKPKDRLEWEKEHDCLLKMRQWMLGEGIATNEDLEKIEKQAQKDARTARTKAWKAYLKPIEEYRQSTLDVLKENLSETYFKQDVEQLYEQLKKKVNPLKSDSVRVLKRILRITRNEPVAARQKAKDLLNLILERSKDEYNSHLYNESSSSALNVEEVKPTYTNDAPLVDGREVVQANFDKIFENNPKVFAIGEDVGKIGDVNQGFAGLQEKYGELRITDTGIREATIMGQAIGAAMRGLRPIAEIQYLDYLLYAIQILSDDVATLTYRTKGGQKTPLIVRTRGHRLEGIWHSGSPMGMILNSLRGMHVLVPRNMTKAAGFYNTLLDSDDPALIIECLNGYRLKENMPDNLSEMRTPLGIPEVIREGSDVTIVTYGSMCRIVMEAATQLIEEGIQCEIIDVQSLLPFDIHHQIVESIKKTNRVLFADEDVSGGASAYMMQKVLDEQNAYYHLDSKPEVLSAQDHRPAYATDGDYFSKPNVEDVFEKVYNMMRESDPKRFPPLYN